MKTPQIEYVVKEHIDESPDTSWIGEYCNYKPGAVKRNPAYVSRNEYEYIFPGITEYEHYKSLHDMGYSKGVAHELAKQYVNQDVKRLEDWNRGEWYFIGIEVIAYVKDVELGRASLWGIESDCGDKYKQEVIEDLKTEARAEVLKNIENLCQCEEEKENN